MQRLLKVILVVLFFIWYSYGATSVEQIHLSPAGPYAMMVTFATIGPKPSGTACAKFKISSGSSDSFSIENGSSTFRWFNQTITGERWSGTVHRVTMTSLLPGSTYDYAVAICDSNNPSIISWSTLYQFRVSDPLDDQFKIIFLADIGNESQLPISFFKWNTNFEVLQGTFPASQATLNHLSREILANDISLILIGGDLTYSSGWETDPPRQSIDDTFYRMLQPIASRVPIITVPGNHELYDWGFDSYDLRIGNSNPKPPNQNRFYTFEMNGVHFLAMSSEESTLESSDQFLLFQQYKEMYFRRSNLVSGTVREWVVSFAHNSQYSSNTAHGSDLRLRSNVEPLFENFVDLALAGHDHTYERTFPVFNGNVTKEILAAFHSSPSSSSTDTFIDPHRTVHVLSGNAGGRLYNTQWSFPAPVWSRFRSTDYFGFTRITFTKSNSSLLVESIDNEDRVRDQFHIVRQEQSPTAEQTTAAPEPTPLTTSAEETTTAPYATITSSTIETTMETPTTTPQLTTFPPITTATLIQETTIASPTETSTSAAQTTSAQSTTTVVVTETTAESTMNNTTNNITTAPSLMGTGTGLAMYISGIIAMVLLVVVVPLFVTIRVCCKASASSSQADTELQALANGHGSSEDDVVDMEDVEGQNEKMGGSRVVGDDDA